MNKKRAAGIEPPTVIFNDAQKKIVTVPLDRIAPNPYQPESRLEVGDDTAEKFGRSILEHGLIQTPLARRAASDGSFEMGDGWLRLAGFRWLFQNGHPEYSAIPLEVKELNNRQMADLVLEANTIRKDLNPIELAKVYKRYIEDFSVTQGELAKHHNCSQGEIANTIRLLELPAELQQKIISQEISETHGRQLLRLNKTPKLQEQLTKETIARNLSVAELSNTVESSLWQNTKSLNPEADRWDKPAFDVNECKDCESKTRASQPYGNQKKEDRCLNTDCWEKKNAAAVQALVKAANETLKERGATGKLVTAAQVNYDQRATINTKEIDNPGECKDCAKTALFKYRADDEGKPERVCLDPACYRKKKTRKTRDTNKSAKEQDQALTEELGKFFRGVANNPKGCLQVIARHVLPRLNPAGKRDLCKMFDVPTLNNGQLDLSALRATLKEKSLDELLQISVAAVMIKERRDIFTSSGFNPELNQELQRDQAVILGNLDVFVAEITAFQEANCHGCQTAIERLIGTGEECCNYVYQKKLDDTGKCRGRQERVGKFPEDKEAKNAGEFDYSLSP